MLGTHHKQTVVYHMATRNTWYIATYIIILAMNLITIKIYIKIFLERYLKVPTDRKILYCLLHGANCLQSKVGVVKQLKCINLRLVLLNSLSVLI